MKNKICFSLLLLVFCFTSDAFSQTQLSILSYNTYNGFQSDTSVQVQFFNWVEKIDPDIIAYQEMNKFTQKGLEKFSSQYGHSYAVLSKTEGYPVALTSKYPIVNVQKVEENMHHIYLYANIYDTHVFVVHFSPFDYRKRTNELRLILAHAATLPQSERIIILGDFNALDRSDSDHYGEALLGDMIKRDKTYNQHNLNDGSLDYSVMDLLPLAGYADTYRLLKDRYQYSMPTKKYRTRSVRRIDYVWVNNWMKEDVIKSDIIIDEATEEMSDHYPMYTEVNLK